MTMSSSPEKDNGAQVGVTEGKEASGCPVKGVRDGTSSIMTGFSGLFGGGNGNGSVPVSGSGSLPIGHPPLSPNPNQLQPDANAKAKTKADTYNAATGDVVFGHERQKDQKIQLSTGREVSSIKKSDFNPAHQPEHAKEWVYPSEQQYYNAMKRKGYNPDEQDVPVILKIHNIVNEQGWHHVRQWEAMNGNPEPKLRQFMGRPQDVSPKARLLSLMGYTPPFDRHDWIVERDDGSQHRYVIDFYKGSAKPSANAPISMHLDVRPALDSPSALLDRLYVFGMTNILGRNPFGPRAATPAPAPAPAAAAAAAATAKGPGQSDVPDPKK
jgi:cytochrome c heme-lyase